MSEQKVDEQQFLARQSKFWDDISQGWSLQNKNPVVGWYHEHQAFPEYETLLFREISKAVGDQIAKGMTVLEYGCGPGRNMIRFKEWFKRIDGVDIAPDCIVKAKVNLTDAGVAIPNLWVNDGKSLPMIPDASYDVVFMVISHQHITNRDVRVNLYNEFNRVLKPGGFLCFQTGFGPGHPRSVDYFTSDYENEAQFVDKDVRVENVDYLRDDVCGAGFRKDTFKYAFSRTCHDEHPLWIWVSVQK